MSDEKRKVTAQLPLRDGSTKLRCGHAFVRADGSIVVNLDFVPRGTHVFQVHASDDPVSSGGHPIFDRVAFAIRLVHGLLQDLEKGALIVATEARLRNLSIELESIPGYQDYLDDLDADEVESGG